MAKKEKQAKPVLHRWRITMLTATPARFLGYVRATDEASAIEAAARDFGIRTALIDRLIATPEE
jgi:hypothetical protein